MNIIPDIQENRLVVLSSPEAQAEVFWLAFQALPEAAQRAVRIRLLYREEMTPELAIELESWQAAGAEALMNFEVLVHEAQ